jgi:hypothetical protein
VGNADVKWYADAQTAQTWAPVIARAHTRLQLRRFVWFYERSCSVFGATSANVLFDTCFRKRPS